jgi:hypothetical protein
MQVSESPVERVEFKDSDPIFGSVLKSAGCRINLTDIGVLVAYMDEETQRECLRLIPWSKVRAVQFKEV